MAESIFQHQGNQFAYRLCDWCIFVQKGFFSTRQYGIIEEAQPSLPARERRCSNPVVDLLKEARGSNHISRRRVMKSCSVGVRFLPALFPFLGGLLILKVAGMSLPQKVSGADEKKPAREEKWKTPPSSSAKPHVEVRFTDNSVLKLKLDDDRLEFVTPHGKLFLPVYEIHKIDFATRVCPDAGKRIQTAVKHLGSSEFRLREAASAELLEFGSSAYPALLDAAKDKDPEVVRRADDLLEKVRNSVPEEELEIRKHDVIHTEDSKIAGWIQGDALKATTTQFGPVQLKLADLKNLRSLSAPSGGDEGTAALDPGNLVNFQAQAGKTFAFRV